MHLRSIKLRGFKSFPDPVEVSLEPGVAVVVGPNGSGKSNVSDAIVWAAGSLTPSEMRAEKPDDVLFGGSATRAAADHCEVELVFDNEDGGFGAELDFSEISIARRLARGGEGQYLVNRTPVRRTDLVELLADVGLGGSMHSIVGQGKVEAVLASKPEDRRALVEEAAGLGKFKRRRHRAELKLARVAAQAERARDVEEEVRKRLRPLALQATAAERAEKLAHEVASLRARVARLDLAVLESRRAEAEERRAAATLARRSAQERLASVLSERESAEIELSDAAGARESAVAALYRLQGAGERLAVREESVGGVTARLREDLDEARRAEGARSDEALRALEQAARAAGAAARDAALESGQAAERARHAHALLAAAERATADEAERRLEAMRLEREAVDRGLGELAGGHGEANRALVALGAARERLRGRHESATSFARRLREEHDTARASARSGAPSPVELEQRANDARAVARASASERDDLAERARSARERLAALERSLAEREGIAPAARVLAAAGERLAVAALEVEPGLEKAVAAALAWRASALLATDPDHGLALLERARTGGLGSLSVVLPSAGTASDRPPLRGAERLGSLVAGPDDALRLLDGIWLVDAERLREVSHGIAITREGHGYDADRGELWFSGDAAEAVLLELDARRRALADEADELTARAEGAAREAAETAATAEAAETAYGAVAHLRGRPLDVELLSRLSAVAEGLRDSTERAAGAVARLEAPVTARLSAADRRSQELGEEIRRLAGLEAEARRDAAEAGRRAADAEVVLARLGGAAVGAAAAGDRRRDDLAVEAAEALARAEEAAARARHAADEARAADAALVERSPRRSRLDVDLLERLVGTSASLGDALRRASALAGRFEAPVRARVDAGSARASGLGGELRRLGAAEVELRQAADEASERVTTVEVELARLDGESVEARRRLDEAEAAGAAGEPAPEEGPETGRDELAARVARLEARREALGKVNPLAREEYEEEKERLERLSVQRADLEASLAELAELRDELTETVNRRFDETFAAVAANFEEVASTLFPGGEGRLRLVEPDGEEGGVAEAGVEVELRPVGKKITRLTLLSGGEKALGAISFLFALFLAKPCPFYLLDEVEAALDDTNIARFVELLRRYADRAQFVVITHQKRTMEAADVLYGVTMGGDGISQIVSRRLPREERTAATA
ncbi:MAG TPA: chromosome segregation protein SMC [Gaiella sp.]|uniref:chromosome segregation protein SMC n=1 Tax=Gaiella sp. TaxID=2663207 RepID=UPI002D809DA1|nr:chromosome segregation protein SMC [Gaiella sp.]HET9287647.1 chromosome segregation protein SMC [Gaiella sp.]